MERMIFDKSYNPFKKEKADGETPALGYDTGDAAFGPSDDEDAEEAARKKAELRARFANAWSSVFSRLIYHTASKWCQLPS